MTKSHPANVTSGTSYGDEDAAAALVIAKWLGLAATPTFASMALLMGGFGAGSMDRLCSTGQGSVLGGMVPMYLLMSVFHSSPWLRLVSGRLRAIRQSR